VLGAAFSGFAVVAMIAIVLRHMLGFEELVTARHLDMLGCLTLACGMMTAFGYVSEVFNALYAGGMDQETLNDRLVGPYAWSFWGAVILNFVPLQALWSRRVRRSPIPLFAIGLSVAIGMWMERYMLLTSSLSRDWLESSFGLFHPTFWDWSLYAGLIGFFFFGFLLFVRFLPIISAFEIRERAYERSRHD
jgi:molybdopterin-containing oxidoreductase family membrane subunit